MTPGLLQELIVASLLDFEIDVGDLDVDSRLKLLNAIARFTVIRVTNELKREGYPTDRIIGDAV